MLNKKQIKDSAECEKMQEQGEDMDCMGCSCSVCIAQIPHDDKLETIKDFISYAEREGIINSESSSKLMNFSKNYVNLLDAQF